MSKVSMIAYDKVGGVAPGKAGSIVRELQKKLANPALVSDEIVISSIPGRKSYKRKDKEKEQLMKFVEWKLRTISELEILKCIEPLEEYKKACEEEFEKSIQTLQELQALEKRRLEKERKENKENPLVRLTAAGVIGTIAAIALGGWVGLAAGVSVLAAGKGEDPRISSLRETLKVSGLRLEIMTNIIMMMHSRFNERIEKFELYLVPHWPEFESMNINEMYVKKSAHQLSYRIKKMDRRLFHANISIEELSLNVFNEIEDTESLNLVKGKIFAIASKRGHIQIVQPGYRFFDVLNANFLWGSLLGITAATFFGVLAYVVNVTMGAAQNLPSPREEVCSDAPASLAPNFLFIGLMSVLMISYFYLLQRTEEDSGKKYPISLFSPPLVSLKHLTLNSEERIHPVTPP